MKEYTACIPRNIDIDKILLEHPPKENLKRDKLLYIIHLLRAIPMHNRANWLNNEWVLINATTLKTVINDYKKYINYLKDDVKLIECDEVAVQGSKSKGYKFRSNNHILIELKLVNLTDKTLMKGLERNFNKDHYGSAYVKKNLPYLHKWFNDKLKLDIPKSTLLDYRSFNASKSINNGTYRLSIDKFGKRIHTPLTRLKKELRQFLTYDNQRLIEVDIKCSQPYLSLKLILDSLSKKEPTIIKSFNEATSNKDKLDIIKNLDGYNGLYKYMSDILIDDLYLAIKDNFETKFGYQIGNGERGHYKEAMFNDMYSRNGYRPKTKILFKEIYGYPSKVYHDLKTVDHKELSKRLQRLESSLILRNICKEINRYDKNIPLFTIHDSILTTPEHIDIVKQFTMDELSREIGLMPRVTVDDFKSSQTMLEQP